jgi:hypothetical protein
MPSPERPLPAPNMVISAAVEDGHSGRVHDTVKGEKDRTFEKQRKKGKRVSRVPAPRGASLFSRMNAV